MKLAVAALLGAGVFVAATDCPARQTAVVGSTCTLDYWVDSQDVLCTGACSQTIVTFYGDIHGSDCTWHMTTSVCDDCSGVQNDFEQLCEDEVQKIKDFVNNDTRANYTFNDTVTCTPPSCPLQTGLDFAGRAATPLLLCLISSFVPAAFGWLSARGW